MVSLVIAALALLASLLADAMLSSFIVQNRLRRLEPGADKPGATPEHPTGWHDTLSRAPDQD